MISRRSFFGTVAGIGTIGLAGCGSSSDDDNDDGGPAAESTPAPAEEVTPQTIIEDTRQVPEGEYYQWSVPVDTLIDVSMSVTVRSGPAVDVFTTTDEEFQHYEDGDRFRVIPELTVKDDTGGERSGTLDSGEYHIVIDNSDAGWAEPPTNFDDDIAQVELEVVAEPGN